MMLLMRLPGVAMIRFLFKQFMVPFTKPTAFVHNMPALHRLKEGVQMWVGGVHRVAGNNHVLMKASV